MKRAVIIGGNAAGLSAASQVKRRQPDWEVVVLEKGTFISYGSCGIPYFIEGLVPNIENLITLNPETAINKRQLDLRTGTEVTGLDLKQKQITIKNSHTTENLSFDYLAICTGASATTAGIEIEGNEGVFTVHSLEDGIGIDNFIREHNPSRAAVIGGGFIAVELVEALHQRGINTHLIHRRESLARNLENEISRALLSEMEEKGVTLNLNRSVKGVESSPSGSTGNGAVVVHTQEGDLSFDMAIIAAGVHPNTGLLENADVDLGLKGAVRINSLMQTNYDYVYAAGDCVETFNRITGEPVYAPLALKANREGYVAGANIAGGWEEFPGIVETAVTKVFELGAARTGFTEERAREAGFDPYKVNATTGSRAHYYPGGGNLQNVLIADRQSKRLLGAQLSGPVEAVKRIDVYSTAITAGMTVEDTFNLDLAYAPPFAPVYDPVITTSRVARQQI